MNGKKIAAEKTPVLTGVKNVVICAPWSCGECRKHPCASGDRRYLAGRDGASKQKTMSKS